MKITELSERQIVLRVQFCEDAYGNPSNNFNIAADLYFLIRAADTEEENRRKMKQFASMHLCLCMCC